MKIQNSVCSVLKGKLNLEDIIIYEQYKKWTSIFSDCFPIYFTTYLVSMKDRRVQHILGSGVFQTNKLLNKTYCLNSLNWKKRNMSTMVGLTRALRIFLFIQCMYRSIKKRPHYKCKYWWTLKLWKQIHLYQCSQLYT